MEKYLWFAITILIFLFEVLFYILGWLLYTQTHIHTHISVHVSLNIYAYIYIKEDIWFMSKPLCSKLHTCMAAYLLIQTIIFLFKLPKMSTTLKIPFSLNCSLVFLFSMKTLGTWLYLCLFSTYSHMYMCICRDIEIIKTHKYKLCCIYKDFQMFVNWFWSLLHFFKRSNQRWPLCIDCKVVHFFTAGWTPLAQKPAGAKFKFVYIQLFLQ